MKTNYFDKYIRKKKGYKKDFSVIKQQLNLSHEIVAPSKKIKYAFRFCLVCLFVVLCFNISRIHELHENMFFSAPALDELFVLYNKNDVSQELQNQVHESIDLKVGYSTKIILKSETLMYDIRYLVNDQKCLRINEKGELTAIKTADHQLYITVEGCDVYGNKTEKIIYINVIDARD